MQHSEAEVEALKEKLNEKASARNDSDSELKKLQQEVAKLEKREKELGEDNNQLIERVAEEVQNKTSLERKFSLENHELEARLNQLNVQFSSRQSLSGPNAPAELEGLESELRRVKRNHDQELCSLKTQLKITEKENLLLKEQVIKATTSEFSDPATIIYQDQISNLTDKLANIDKGHSKERRNLQRKILELEQENEGLEKRKLEISSFYDSKLAEITEENEQLKQQNLFPSHTSTDQLANSLAEQDSKYSAKIAQLETQDLQKRVRQLQEDYVSMEKKFVNSKMGWAQAEIEKENLLTKYREAQEQLRIYSADYTTMEVELYKLNERFGQTINTHNDLEMENQLLKADLEQYKSGGKKKKKQ